MMSIINNSVSSDVIKNIALQLEKNNKKKINVAICLSGQPRFCWGKSYDSIKKYLLDIYNCDVYCHFWLKKEDNYNYPFSPHLNCFKDGVKINYQETTKQISDLFKPISCVIEEPREFKQFYIPKIQQNYAIKNFPSMFYSIHQADLLRQQNNNQKYDFVIRCRTDTLLGSFPDLSKLEKGYLYIPDNCPNPIVYNDNFSICSPDVAERVYNLFTYLEDPVYNVQLYEPPECIWTYHLRNQNIKIKLLNFEQDIARSL